LLTLFKKKLQKLEAIFPGFDSKTTSIKKDFAFAITSLVGKIKIPKLFRVSGRFS